MADAYICRRGGSGGSGGGSELVIVGGTTSPAKAGHNTIWLNTPNTITSYVLVATEPTGPVEGMAWITIGASGPVKMVSPVGDEWITVYPLSAKQYIGGTWADVEAKCYQNGEWVDWWNGELYTPGNEWVNVTGGWQSRGWKLLDSTYVAVAPTLNKTANCMEIKLSSTKFASGVVEVVKDIDLSKTKTLTIDFEASVASYAIHLFVINRNATLLSNNVASLTLVQEDMGSTKTVARNTVNFILNDACNGKFDVAIAFVNKWGNSNIGGTVKVYSLKTS